MITILGQTASGKTRIAAMLADKIGGEVISADSRQVYRGMTLGTGKDLNDYIVNDRIVPYHLIDIIDAGDEYNVFDFMNDFRRVYLDITGRGKIPILCGGSGMYLEAVLKGYDLKYAPANDRLREALLKKTDDELIAILTSHRSLHNVSDTRHRDRLIRAVEIALQTSVPDNFLPVDSIVFGIHFEREVLRNRITERLMNRLNLGMIDEVKQLMNNGVSVDMLKYYGLEYKYIAMFIIGEMDFNLMFQKLNTAIHQFAKRQMTWFRRMQKNGFDIIWIDGNLSDKDKMDFIKANI